VYVGHYAFGIGLASVRPENRAVTLLTLAAIAPDLPAAALQLFGRQEGWALTHGWAGLLGIALLMALTVVGLRGSAVNALLAAIATVSHGPFDAFAQQLYERPALDALLEIGLLVAASYAYAARTKRVGAARRRWWTACAMVAAAQGVWDAMLAVGT
jgi:hypothetical protein